MGDRPGAIQRDVGARVPSRSPLRAAARLLRMRRRSPETISMGINRESEVAANLQIGPTTLGMVRLYIETESIELPLDFDPDEAEEIAEELRIAAEKARAMGGKKGKPGRR
jgi:hypothetical protein